MTIRHVLPLTAALASMSVMVGCDGDSSIEPTLDSIQTEVFTPRCALESCHGGSNPVQGLDLRRGQAYDSLVEVMSPEGDHTRVIPGDPETSLLYRVLQGPVEEIGQMPQGGMLSQPAIDAIYDWIDMGAPEAG